LVTLNFRKLPISRHIFELEEQAWTKLVHKSQLQLCSYVAGRRRFLGSAPQATAKNLEGAIVSSAAAGSIIEGGRVKVTVPEH